jgi:hypothetical protein
MSNMSLRAFEEAQRRRLYPKRNGALGVSCMQRDVLLAIQQLTVASEYFWLKEKTGISVEDDVPTSNAMKFQKNHFQEAIGRSMMYLLQVTGAAGIDLFAAVKSELEKKEMEIV